MKRLVLCPLAILALALAMSGAALAETQLPPRFQLGFQQLADQMPEIVGEPLENEQVDPRTGDSFQQTTEGLLVWQKADNRMAFTDGKSAWIDGPFGVQQRGLDERFDWETGAPLSLLPDPLSEATLLDKVNLEREKVGLPPLQLDPRLSQIARGHSLEMLRLGYFDHESPLSGSPFDRIRQAGIDFQVAGENMCRASSVEVAHEALMESPSHRADILDPEFRRIGIGVVVAEGKESMITQEFTN